MHLEKIAKNAGNRMFKRYSHIFYYDTKDYEQECRLVLWKISSDKNNKRITKNYLYKSCYNNIIVKIKRLKDTSNNNKEKMFDFDSIDSEIDMEKRLIIKQFFESLSKEEQKMLTHYIENGVIPGETSTKFPKFKVLKKKLEDVIKN